MDRRVFPGKQGTPLPRAAVVDKTVAVGSSGANPATAGEGKPFKSEEMTPNPKIPAAAREPYVNVGGEQVRRTNDSVNQLARHLSFGLSNMSKRV